MIAWHLVLFILLMTFLIYKVITVEKGYGDYSFDLETPLYVLLIIIVVVVYGGIFWW